jgi:tetratricopeptide (TPR) repeat protein
MSLKDFFAWTKNKTIGTKVYVEGSVNGGNVAGRDIHITNNGIPLEKLVELAKQLGVVESERDAWIQKYQDLEKFVASRTDDIAKRAKAFLDEGDLEQAEKLFEQALATGLKNDAANAFSLAEIKVLQLNQAKAKTYYNQAVQLDPDNAHYWNQLGHLLQRVGELDEAITAYQKVLALGETHQNQQEIAVALGNLGLVYDTRGESDNSIEFYKKALTIVEVLDDKEKMAAVYDNLGNVYQTLGELDNSIEFYKKALTIDESMSNKEGMAAGYANLGMIYYTRGDLDKVIEFQQKSLAITEVLDDKEKMAAVYGNLGSVYYARGDLDKAIAFYEKALVIDEGMGRKEGMAEDYGNLGNVYKKKGNIAEANRYYQKSIELYKYIGSPNEKLVQGWLDALH